MNKKSKVVFYTFALLSFILVFEVVYIQSAKSMNRSMLDSKLEFVELVGLPDLAISTEANYIRHRSLTGVFSIYKDDGTLREYFPSTFVYSHSNILNQKR